jgi:hypothetical protein
MIQSIKALAAAENAQNAGPGGEAQQLRDGRRGQLRDRLDADSSSSSGKRPSLANKRDPATPHPAC